MDLYTLSDQFLTKGVLDEYVSAIWNERYSVAGDCQLVVQASPDNMELLSPGTYLALRGSKETMIIETQLIEKGLMTVTGRSLVTFLDHRPGWFRNPLSAAITDRVADYTDASKTPGAFIADVVNKLVINTTPFTSSWSDANLTWDNEEIPYLSLGAVDNSGTAKKLSVPVGPLYQGISKVAQDEDVGIILYLASASSTTGYTLKFSTYRGVDRTTGSVNDLMRLSPDMDSLQDIKEVRSNQDYKNVCYVYYQGKITKHLLYPGEPEPEGLDRRVIVTNAEGEPVGRKTTTGRRYDATTRAWVGYTYVSPVTEADILEFRKQNARDVFAQHNYIQAIDGQSSPQNDYKYGIDYGLGDIIELEGLTGTISKARITEYIRTEDATGYKEYPTISIIDKPT